MKESILIEGLRDRDKVIFDYVFHYYYSGLCAFSLKYLDDSDAVEDLVQDFFVSLWVDGARLQINTSLKSYLFASVKNKCLDFHKHQDVKKKYRSFLIASNMNVDQSAELMFAESELRAVIQSSMEKLAPRCRQIFEMSRSQGMSNQEISDQLGLSKRTVELQISNAIKILRAELADYLPILVSCWLIC